MSCLISFVSVEGMSSLFFMGGDRADPMPGKNERQGRSTNIFFFHEGSLQGHFKGSSSAESLRSPRLLLPRDTPGEVSVCCKRLGEFMRLNPPADCLETPSALPATCKTQTRPAPARR